MQLPFLRLAALGSSLGFLMPAVALAADLYDTLLFLSNILNALIGLLITLAIVVFFWGLVKYLWSMETETAHEALKLMFWGVISIFVMVSIWGIIALLRSSLKVEQNTANVPSGIRPVIQR